MALLHRSAAAVQMLSLIHIIPSGCTETGPTNFEKIQERLSHTDTGFKRLPRLQKALSLGSPGPGSSACQGRVPTLTTRQHVGGGRQRGHGREAAGGPEGERGEASHGASSNPRGGEGKGASCISPPTGPTIPHALTSSRAVSSGTRRERADGSGLREGRGCRQARSGNGVGHGHQLLLATTFVVVVASDVPVPGHDGSGRVARPLTVGRWA